MHDHLDTAPAPCAAVMESIVEVVAGEQTSDATVATTMRFCEDVELRAVRVHKEIPGFLWNRVWSAMLREMLHLVDVGAVGLAQTSMPSVGAPSG